MKTLADLVHIATLLLSSTATATFLERLQAAQVPMAAATAASVPGATGPSLAPAAVTPAPPPPLTGTATE